MNHFIRILSLLLLCSLLGCQGDNRPTVWTGDDKAVSEVIDDWNDVDKTDSAAAAALFVKDAQPTVAQLRIFRKYNIIHNGPPKISGTTATMPVLVYLPKANGQPTALDWTFEKEGEAWKIKTAPLP
jgi:hypothetical protein